MSYCLDCHRNPATRLRPLDKITDLDWKAADADQQLAHGQRVCSRLEIAVAAELFDLSSMKTIPPPCPEPEIGPKYWRSLDQVADTPEFRQWMEREFPAGASEWTDPVSRRNFVKIMSASFLLAGLGATGCRRPVEKIYPFAKMPENYLHGVPQFFATAMPARRGAVPLIVKSNDGRPTKIEGNPDLPDSNGGTDALAQASVLGLYDPDRSMRFARNGSDSSRQAALGRLDGVKQVAWGRQRPGVSARTKQFPFARPPARGHCRKISQRPLACLSSRSIWIWGVRPRPLPTACPSSHFTSSTRRR